jgi:hypothetical protein
MDKVEQLYNLYLEKKLITNATSLEKFRSAGADQQDALYNLGKKNNLFKETTFDTFKSAWTPSDVKKKDEPEQESTPQQEAPSKPSAKPSPPSGKEAKIKELTVKASELAASGDQQGLAKIRQEIVALKKEAAPIPFYEKSVDEDLSRPEKKPLNISFTKEELTEKVEPTKRNETSKAPV